MDLLIFGRVGFAVPDARARAHSLRVSTPDDRAAAHAVAMRERARDDVGDDFHIAMAVRGKATSGRHHVFVDHTQRAKRHVRRIVIIAKGKSVISVEPTKIKVATIISLANFYHWFFFTSFLFPNQRPNKLMLVYFPNPRSGWKHKAWGGAKRNPRITN